MTDIRRLGGTVDTVWPAANSGCLVTAAEGSPNEWRTAVFLTDSWKGDAATLQLLRGLHQLKALYLVRAPLTDSDLKAVASLQDLEVLHLQETKVTNAGLDIVKELPS